ncbi:LAMI_0A03994g1_1 [Lachancea mirantina]|uniref:Ubiquitin carboxyl-terminal hydrolase n=1 Tax=Lachancea mirantina TaxID=1230905 RepID=A0A1G4INL8_9SACH|nr:LAMI_0A03994g1_1 [Lachancea mirantina]
MECPHIEQVFTNEKTRDGVLRTYNLILQIIDKCDMKNRVLHSMKCYECQEINAGATFMCLQCGICGCWNKQHFYAHSRSAGHIFGVNSSNGLLFCFKCGDYIGGSELIWQSSLMNEWPRVAAQTRDPPFWKRDGLCGLVNMGSTCFMSCILQTLAHNPYFSQHCLQQTHFAQCDLQDGTRCMSCAFDQVMSNFYGTSGADAGATASGRDLASQQQGFINLLICSWKMNKSLAGYSQQDAHEFWQFFLNQLHNDHTRIRGKKTASKSMAKSGSCDCIAHTTFEGLLRSSIRCSECQDDTTTTFDPIFDQSLDIKNKTTLEECLESFHKGEKLTDFNYKCQKCGSQQSPLKELSVARLAPIHVLQLKRFEHLVGGNSVKIDAFVSFPQYLNMGRFCYRDGVKTPPNMIYELIGVTTHGGSVNQGHYTSMCKIPGGQWFKFNDSMVTSIAESAVLKQQAYLLFYVLRPST